MACDERTIDELRGKYNHDLKESPFSDELLGEMVKAGLLEGSFYPSTGTLLISENSFVQTVIAGKHQFDHDLSTQEGLNLKPTHSKLEEDRESEKPMK